MILNTGNRTDIPAYYSKWFINRIKEGFVMVRNPYNPKLITKYILDPKLIDVMVFCSKNPKPLLEQIDILKPFNQYWFVTITPYGKDIELNVPNKYEVINTFIELSKIVGINNIVLRYDPIFINEKYNEEYHYRAFDKILSLLNGYNQEVIISFIDLYEKTKKNFPEGKEVSPDKQKEIVGNLVKISEKYNMRIKTCLERKELDYLGVDSKGCLTKEVLEKALNKNLDIPKLTPSRNGCSCLLGNDIGAYNTCGHMCRYCYANYSKEKVIENMKLHDPDSPLLIGNINSDDVIKEAKQISYIDNQIRLF